MPLLQPEQAAVAPLCPALPAFSRSKRLEPGTGGGRSASGVLVGELLPPYRGLVCGRPKPRAGGGGSLPRPAAGALDSKGDCGLTRPEPSPCRCCSCEPGCAGCCGTCCWGAPGLKRPGPAPPPGAGGRGRNGGGRRLSILSPAAMDRMGGCAEASPERAECCLRPSSTAGPLGADQASRWQWQSASSLAAGLASEFGSPGLDYRPAAGLPTSSAAVAPLRSAVCRQWKLHALPPATQHCPRLLQAAARCKCAANNAASAVDCKQLQAGGCKAASTAAMPAASPVGSAAGGPAPAPPS